MKTLCHFLVAAITAKGEVIFISHHSVKMNPDTVIMASSLPNSEIVKSVAFYESTFMVLSSSDHVFLPEFQSWNNTYNNGHTQKALRYRLSLL